MTDLIDFLRQRHADDERTRHHPERTLREVEATRRLIERYELACKGSPHIVSYTRGQDHGYREACLDAILDAAEVHADHPDYREEWRA